MAKNRPTVLVISQVYVPDAASVGQHMHDAAKALASRGYRVRVLTSARGYEDPTQKYAKREMMDGVSIVRLPLSSFGKSSIAVRLIGGVIFTLQCIFRGLFLRNLKHVLVSTSPPMCSLAAVAIRLLRKVHITYWVMDLNPDQMIELGKLKEDALSARIFNTFNRWILRTADEVVALDRFMVERLLKKLDVKEKITVLPPWPHAEHLAPVEHRENPFRKEHGLDGKFVLMYSGNHGYSTPVNTVLDAAVKMQDRENLQFMFIGGGVGKRDVEQTISQYHPKNLVSLPYQPFDRVRYSLSAADVHLVSVGNDVVGVVHPCKVYGAMALGRPILLLGPKCCHVSDIIEEEHVGWHIQHGDVEGAVAVIDRILETPPDELRCMGQRAAELIRKRFNQQEMIDTFCDIVTREPNSTDAIDSRAAI